MSPSPTVPTREAFAGAARRGGVFPVRRELLADQVTPVAVFHRICGEEAGFLLESVDHGGRWSRWSFVGRRPLARLVARGSTVATSGSMPWPRASSHDPAGVLAAVEAMLDACRIDRDPDLPPLHSGIVGYLGYDVVREVEHLPAVPLDDHGRPDAVLSVIGDLVALYHWTQRAVLIANVFVPAGADDATVHAAYDEACVRLDELARAGANAGAEPMVSPPGRDEPLPEVRPSMDADAYRDAVEAAKEYIRAGDVFQVVLATRFDVEVDADPFDVYRVLRQLNPSPYMYFVREPEVCLVGCSPEPMVQLLDGTVISRPIAGTRFRGSNDEHDRRLGAELLEHPKERAEHIMLVDLARNDVGRVVEFGTCTVDEMMTLERFSHVMHLTSQVSGTLAAGRSPIDVLRATMPAGTVSGAPKVRAMEIIDELEPVKRGPYAGVVGYLDFSGNIDTAIGIRTMVLDMVGPDGNPARRPFRASVQAGAGIVADSDPFDEELETRNKAKALLAAVGPAERMTAERAAGGDATTAGGDPLQP
ncbi:MAG: chorismate-binding protein [Microthrixaceae bacterium]